MSGIVFVMLCINMPCSSRYRPKLARTVSKWTEKPLLWFGCMDCGMSRHGHRKCEVGMQFQAFKAKTLVRAGVLQVV